MTMPSSFRPTAQSGNMLVYILGALFLMGLLVVLVRGTGNPGAGADEETTVIRASDAQRYAGELERAVAQIMQNGHSENDIRFSHADAESAYQTTMQTPFTRQVFDAAGGAAEYRMPPDGINDGTRWQFYATTHVRGLGTNSSPKPELIMVLPNVTESFCNRINLLNDQAINLATPQDPTANGCIYAPGNEFTGTYATSNINTFSPSVFTHEPATQACIRCQGGNLHFYHVLLAR